VKSHHFAALLSHTSFRANWDAALLGISIQKGLCFKGLGQNHGAHEWAWEILP
jgi:hypothetical protein